MRVVYFILARGLSSAFDAMSPTQKEQHGMIRAMSEHSLAPTNEALLAWLNNDKEFKTNSIAKLAALELDKSLLYLEVHLMLWQAKRRYWLSSNSKHALVYLADESDHGPPFPTELRKIVPKALALL